MNKLLAALIASFAMSTAFAQAPAPAAPASPVAPMAAPGDSNSAKPDAHDPMGAEAHAKGEKHAKAGKMKKDHSATKHSKSAKAAHGMKDESKEDVKQ